MIKGKVIGLTNIGMSSLNPHTTDLSLCPFVRSNGSLSIDFGLIKTDKSVCFRIVSSRNVDTLLNSIDGLSELDGVSSSISPPVTITRNWYIEPCVLISSEGSKEFEIALLYNLELDDHISITVIGSRPTYNISQPAVISMEQAIIEAYARVMPKMTFYDTLQFTDNASGDSLMVVHSDDNLITPQGEYTRCRFGCKHPDAEGGVVGSMQITISFLPTEAQKWLMSKSKAGSTLSMYWRQYTGPNEEPKAYYPVPIDITSVNQKFFGVTISGTFPMLTSMKFPRRMMTTSELPGGM